MQGEEPDWDPGSDVEPWSYQGEDFRVPGRNTKLPLSVLKFLFRFVSRSSAGPLRFTSATGDTLCVETVGPEFR